MRQFVLKDRDGQSNRYTELQLIEHIDLTNDEIAKIGELALGTALDLDDGGKLVQIVRVN